MRVDIAEKRCTAGCCVPNLLRSEKAKPMVADQKVKRWVGSGLRLQEIKATE